MKVNSKYNIELDKSQIFNLIRQLDTDDKIELLNSLQESTYVKRFEKLLNSLRTDKISLDDITKEVESVRQKRYEQGKHDA
jgi:Mg/Co/Ni transporter MgtE